MKNNQHHLNHSSLSTRGGKRIGRERGKGKLGEGAIGKKGWMEKESGEGGRVRGRVEVKERRKREKQGGEKREKKGEDGMPGGVTW